MDARLLVVDPLLSHLSGKTNTHIDHEVKLALRPLMQLAHNTGCTVLGNGHFSKDKSGGARRAASASTAFTNTPRVGLAMAYDNEDSDVRVLEVIKSNIGPKGVGRNYRVKTVQIATVSTSRCLSSPPRAWRRRRLTTSSPARRRPGETCPERAAASADPGRVGDRRAGAR